MLARTLAPALALLLFAAPVAADPVLVNPGGTAEADFLAVGSDEARATRWCPPAPRFQPCIEGVAVSVDGDAHGAVAASLAGDAEAKYAAVSGLGHADAAYPPHWCAFVVNFFVCRIGAAASGTGDAEGEVAVTGTGDAHADAVAVSALGDARTPGHYHACTGLASLKRCSGGVAIAGGDAHARSPCVRNPVDETCLPGASVALTGDATGHYGCVPVDDVPRCYGPVAVSALGDATSTCNEPSKWAPFQHDCRATTAVSGTGDARSRCSEADHSECDSVAVSGTGRAHGRHAVSGCELAGACTP